eukprot:1469373-Amphidinium_carterae.2
MCPLSCAWCQCAGGESKTLVQTNAIMRYIGKLAGSALIDPSSPLARVKHEFLWGMVSISPTAFDTVGLARNWRVAEAKLCHATLNHALLDSGILAWVKLTLLRFWIGLC